MNDWDRNDSNDSLGDISSTLYIYKKTRESE